MDMTNSAGAAMAASASGKLRLLDHSGERVLAVIAQAAEAGQPCPSNEVLSEIIGAKTTSGGASVMARLRRLGLIEVKQCGRSRIVTIVATGKATAGPANPSNASVSGPWTPEETERLERELAAGKGLAEIAYLLGRAKSSVWHRVNPTRRAAETEAAPAAQPRPERHLCHNCGTRFDAPLEFSCAACRPLRSMAA